MTTVIRAYRDKPLTRPAQLDRVIERFGLVEEVPIAFGTIDDNGVMRLERTGANQADVSTYELLDGDRVELDICLEGDDAAKAPDLIRDLRMCGFVAGIDER